MYELFCFFCMNLLPERSPVHCTAHERNTVLKNGRHSGAESVEAGVDESSTISYSYKIKMMCKFYFHRCNTLSRNNENFKTTEVKFLFRSYHGRIGRMHPIKCCYHGDDGCCNNDTSCTIHRKRTNIGH